MVKIYKIFVNTLFVLLIAVLGIYVFFRFTNKVVIYNVKTGSMEDNIHVGDYILIYKKNDYNVGDVVTYKKNNYFITHRIIRKDNNQIVTKGDANNTEDETIDISDIVGKVIISGGILNIIVNYKFAIAAIFVALYLISCYFKDEKEEIIDNQELDLEDNNEEELCENNQESESKEEEKIDDDKISNKEETIEKEDVIKEKIKESDSSNKQIPEINKDKNELDKKPIKQKKTSKKKKK